VSSGARAGGAATKSYAKKQEPKTTDFWIGEGKRNCSFSTLGGFKKRKGGEGSPSKGGQQTGFDSQIRADFIKDQTISCAGKVEPSIGGKVGKLGGRKRYLGKKRKEIFLLGD